MPCRPGTAVRSRGEQTLLEHAGELRCHRPRPDRTPSGACGRPRRGGSEARAAAGPRGTRLPPGQIPLDRTRRSRRGPGQGPRIGRGRRPPQSRAHAADRTRIRRRRTRRARRELVRDPRDAGARMWDALVQTAQHALDTDLPPDSHGAPARLMVTTTLESLRDRAWPTTPSTSSPSRPSDGWRVTPRSSPPSSAARGEPLDVGRAKRLVTLAIWAALVIRDRHCAFPGCDRPPLMCHAHHIRPLDIRRRDQARRISSYCVVTTTASSTIHPWEVRINPNDLRPEFLPPPKPGVARHWIRYRPRRE